MRNKLIISVSVAALLWFVMFNPWMGLASHFWLIMAISSAILITLAFLWGEIKLRFNIHQIAFCILIAAVLWGIFWTGDKLSSLMFNFSRPQVDSIYAMGEGAKKWLVAMQLIALTGPAEEIFWRGFIQQRLTKTKGPFAAMLITLVIYSLSISGRSILC